MKSELPPRRKSEVTELALAGGDELDAADRGGAAARNCTDMGEVSILGEDGDAGLRTGRKAEVGVPVVTVISSGTGGGG